MGPEIKKPGEEYAGWKAPETGKVQPAPREVKIGIADRTRAIGYFRETANYFDQEFTNTGYKGDQEQAGRWHNMTESVSDLLTRETSDAFGVSKAIAEAGKNVGLWQLELRGLEGQYGKAVEEKRREAEVRTREAKAVLGTLTTALFGETKPVSNVRGELYRLSRRLNLMGAPALSQSATLNSPEISTLTQQEPGRVARELDTVLGRNFEMFANNRHLSDKEIYDGVEETCRLQAIRDQIS